MTTRQQPSEPTEGPARTASLMGHGDTGTTAGVGGPFGRGQPLTGAQTDFLRAAMAQLEGEYGLPPQDFRLVPTTAAPTGGLTVIDASPNGRHLGTYREILNKRSADPHWYSLLVLGRRLDLLSGCTRQTYGAMIARLREEENRFLPDSLALNQHNGHVWTATIITGEPLPSADMVWIASSSGGRKVNYLEHPVGRGGRSFRVRPAFALPETDC